MMGINISDFVFIMLIFFNIVVFHFGIMKRLKNNNNIVSLLSYVFLFLAHIIIKLPIPIVFLLSSLWAIYSFYKIFHNLGQAWLLTLFFYIIVGISILLSLDINRYLHLGLNTYVAYTLEFGIYISLFLIFYFIDKKYHLTRYLIVLKKNQYKLLLVYTLITLVILFMVNCFLDKNYRFYFYVDFQFFVCIILLFLYITYIIYIEYQLAKLSLEYSTFVKKEDYYQELDGFRHDFKDILFSLYATIEEEDITETKNILDNISNYSVKIIDNNQLLNVNDKTIRGMIEELQKGAEEKGIDLKLEIPEKVTFDSINTFDLVRLLSIIINNAIEASEEEKSEVNLSIVNESKTHIRIICKNKVSAKNNIDINQLLKKNYTTKEHHQGLGLMNFEKISKQYKNLVYKFTVDTNAQAFIVTIDIFD